MKPGGIVGAFAAAAVGAIAWALVVKLTGYEVGYVAWGIGALIGFASGLLGGTGVGNGVVCAALALSSIATGKVLGSMWTTESDLTAFYTDDMLSQDNYNMMMAEANEFSKITSEKEYPKFLADNAYFGITSVDEVTPDDIEAFKSVNAVKLKQMASSQPSYEQWKDSESSEVAELAARYAAEESSMWGLSDHITWSKDNLAPMDLLFAVLGVASAFALGKGREEQPAA